MSTGGTWLDENSREVLIEVGKQHIVGRLFRHCEIGEGWVVKEVVKGEDNGSPSREVNGQASTKREITR